MNSMSGGANSIFYTNVKIYDNTASSVATGFNGYGGAIYVSEGTSSSDLMESTLLIQNSKTIYNNQAKSGGFIYMSSVKVTLKISNCKLESHSASD